MFGHFSYFASVLIFAGAAIFIEAVFGYHIVKYYIKLIGLIVLIGLIGSPIGESIALVTKDWVYNPATTLYQLFLGSEVETYFFTFCVCIAVGTAAIAWTNYEDRGMPIFKSSLKDLVEGTFAIWRKEPKRKVE